MKTKMKTFISMITILCLLAAFLSGCGSTQITEASETTSASQQENRPDQSQDQKDDRKTDAPEMEKMEIPEEDIAALLQAGMDAVAEESDLWIISEITDTEILMQLTQSRGDKKRPEGESGEAPENMTPPDGEEGQRPDGEMPEGTMPEHGSETPHENMDGTFSEGEMGEGSHGRGEGGGKQPENRSSGMAALAIVISNSEGTEIAAEDIFAEIEETATELGYNASRMSVSEDQSELLDIAQGYTPKEIVIIRAENMSREKQPEAAG